MKGVANDLALVQFPVLDFTPLFVMCFVEPDMDFQALRRRCAADRLHDDLVRLQRYAPPVACDMAEEAMLDLVPLARSRRIMTDLDDQAGLVGKSLQLRFPKSG